MDGNLNLYSQAAATTLVDPQERQSQKSAQVEQTGTLGGLSVTFNANDEVDPTTKDDEMMSAFQAEKKAEQAKKDHAKRKGRGKNTPIEKVSKAIESEQTNQGKDAVKRIMQRIALARSDQPRFNYKLNERAQQLFPESLPQYKEAFEHLSTLNPGASPQAFLSAVAKTFNDIAEQHNALQVAIGIFSDEMALLAGGELEDINQPGQRYPVSGRLSRISSRLEEIKDAHTKEADEERENLEIERTLVQDRIDELKEKLSTLEEATGVLMDKEGARINDSYRLAPELREVLEVNKDLLGLRSSKDLNAIILDKILPLKGNQEQLFGIVMEELLDKVDENQKPDEQTPAAKATRLTNNLEIIREVLSNELKNLQGIRQMGDSKNIEMAIWQSFRMLGEFGSMFRANEDFLAQTYKAHAEGIHVT